MAAIQSSYSGLFKESVAYNNKKIIAFIVIAKYTKNERKKEKYTLLIFKSMKEIIVRNKNNFWSLANGLEMNHQYEDDDIYQECFFVLHKVIRDFKVYKKYNFYFYYNKALSRHFYRFYEKLKKDKVSYHEDLVDKQQKLQTQNNFSTFDIDLASFSRFERRLIRFIISGKNNVQEFCQKNKISVSKFHDNKKQIILKLKDLYNEQGVK